MSEPTHKKAKGEAADQETARLQELVQRAARGQDVSPLLISVTGHKVDPSTPTVGRRLPLVTPPPALHLACHCGDLAAVKALLSSPVAQASVGVLGGPRNWMPIVYATFMGHMAIVKLLVDAGSPIPGEKVLCRAIGGGQTQMLSWLLGPAGLDINQYPKALRKAVVSDFPRMLTTVLSLSRLSQASLDLALEWAVQTGSSARLSHLLEAGASPATSKALAAAVAEDSTLMAHKLLATLSVADVARFGSSLVEAAARNANPELVNDLLQHGACVGSAAIAAALEAASSKSQEDVARTLVGLLRRGAPCGSAENHPLVAAAQRVVEDARPATIEGEEDEIVAQLVGHEKDFVADKPVEQPRQFCQEMRRGRVLLIGRSDSASGHAVDVDLSDISSAASVSRTHALLRYHAGRQVWQLRSVGRNGLFDDRGRFFPPHEDWIDLSVFPGGRFEIGWTKFEVKPV